MAYYSREGGIVLGPTAGGGSLGIVCKDMDREFIGIEFDDISQTSMFGVIVRYQHAYSKTGIASNYSGAAGLPINGRRLCFTEHTFLDVCRFVCSLQHTHP